MTIFDHPNEVKKTKNPFKLSHFLLITCACTAASLSTTSMAHSSYYSDRGAVFVMTNNAEENEVIAYERESNGVLHHPRKYRTGGRGSGGNNDPLTSQGSLTLSSDGSYLYAVNAGSGELSVFRVEGSRLSLLDKAPTSGSEPNAVAQRGNIIYVLNTAGSSSVVGFRLHRGNLIKIPNSQRFLSRNNAVSTSIAFSPNGQFLTVIERGSNVIDTFHVESNGTLSPVVTTPSAGAGAFANIFTPNGVMIVSETGTGPNSFISSYALQADGTLTPISTSVPTLATANCWNAITPDGKYVYTSNAGSSNISGFSISGSGALTPLPGTVVGANPSGSGNLDIAISGDGKFLYSLNNGNGTVGMFAIRSNGALTNLGYVPGLMAMAGFNGIAVK